jgi:hypothetical protein
MIRYPQGCLQRIGLVRWTLWQLAECWHNQEMGDTNDARQGTEHVWNVVIDTYQLSFFGVYSHSLESDGLVFSVFSVF